MKINEFIATLPCIVCDKPLESALPSPRGQINQPAYGTCFSSRGHYGSTVFDPMDHTRAEINICDECWKKKEPSILIIHDSKPATLLGSE